MRPPVPAIVPKATAALRELIRPRHVVFADNRNTKLQSTAVLLRIAGRAVDRADSASPESDAVVAVSAPPLASISNPLASVPTISVPTRAPAQTTASTHAAVPAPPLASISNPSASVPTTSVPTSVPTRAPAETTASTHAAVPARASKGADHAETKRAHSPETVNANVGAVASAVAPSVSSVVAAGVAKASSIRPRDVAGAGNTSAAPQVRAAPAAVRGTPDALSSRSATIALTQPALAARAAAGAPEASSPHETVRHDLARMIDTLEQHAVPTALPAVSDAGDVVGIHTSRIASAGRRRDVYLLQRNFAVALKEVGCDVRVVSAAINAFAACNYGWVCVELFRSIVSKNQPLSVSAVVGAVEGCASNLKGPLVAEAEEAVSAALQQGILETTILTCLVKVYARAGSSDLIFEILRTRAPPPRLHGGAAVPVARFPSEYALSAAASVCGTASMRARLLEYVSDNGYLPNTYFWTSLVAACLRKHTRQPPPAGISPAEAEERAFRDAFAVFRDMRRWQSDPATIGYAMLLSRAGALPSQSQRARTTEGADPPAQQLDLANVVRRLSLAAGAPPSASLANAVMAYYGTIGAYGMATNVFMDLLAGRPEGVTPTTTACNAAANVCAHSGNAALCKTILDEVEARAKPPARDGVPREGVRHSSEVLAAGTEAIEVEAPLVSSLFRAAARARDVELATRVVRLWRSHDVYVPLTHLAAMRKAAEAQEDLRPRLMALLYP